MNEQSDGQNQSPPKADPALKRLERLVGVWKLTGRPLGSDKDTIYGTTSFTWLHASGGIGFFLQQDMEMDYDGTAIKSHELIGYDSTRDAFTSQVYSNMATEPWPYEWAVEGDDITISIRKDSMNATFHGKFASDGSSFSGGWRPNPGADEAINAPYDVTAVRVA